MPTSEPRRTIPAYFHAVARAHGERAVQEDREGKVSLNELLAQAARLANGLREAGVEVGHRVGLYADNSRRWLLCDLALQLARAVSVPRGTDTPVEEYVGFCAHSDVRVILVHAQRHADRLEAMRSQLPEGTTLVVMDPEGATTRTVDDLIADGEGPDFEAQQRDVVPEDLATIIYTSGTTGRPKGVMLCQSNFGHQVASCPNALDLHDDLRFLSVLPPWHIFERTVEYVAIVKGCRVVYTDRRRLKEDMVRYQPHYLPSVPRIWETVYAGVRKAVQGGSPVKRGIFHGAHAAGALRARAWDRARRHHLRLREPRGIGHVVEGVVRGGALVTAVAAWLPAQLGDLLVFRRLRAVTGGNLRGAISGGGLMPPHVDRFFRAIGIPVLVGYGLTETSPVISVRRPERNVLGTIGTLVREVEVEVRHPETHAALDHGEVGVIWTRGPHVMQGYYRDPELTASVVDAQGWFNTGDLGLLTESGDLCFRGRIKETIVLSGGENVEPTAVETAIVASGLIEQAIVVGQDRKTLAALVVPQPETVREALSLPASADYAQIADDPRTHDLLRRAIIERTSGLRAAERVSRIVVQGEPMTAENGLLTQTLKPRRHVIVQRFAPEIERAYTA